jgi:hypothetical protein
MDRSGYEFVSAIGDLRSSLKSLMAVSGVVTD